MNSEITYQSPDINTSNPLMSKTATSTFDSCPQSKTFIPKNPKIIILIVLGIIVVILLILSIFISADKPTAIQKPTSQQISPTTMSVQPTTTPITVNIPENIRTKLDQIDKNNQRDINFNPPQIDTSIGL